MRKTINYLALAFLTLGILPMTIQPGWSQTSSWPDMAPVEQYLMPKDAEVALARSAAPASVADDATVMVLGRQGYTTAAQGTNGFLCYVERSWAKGTDDPEFWNPNIRSPNCFNAAAAKSIAPIYLKKTQLVLAGQSRAEIARAIATDLDGGQLPPLEPGAMCYMMSKQQYLNDRDRNWYPHLMFYVAGNVASSWGANLPGSPVIAANDAEARVTVMMVVVRHWSDGTPGPH
ncbi:MAG TPA: hypothetical protein VMD25_13235 [Acidobacteriaceae bacterium]|nr:hypothetical protein [Acidobacteriaceae bacterium]